MMITFTDSEVMALADIVGEHLRRPGHTEAYVDVMHDVTTTPEGLLARLLTARAAPRLMLRLRYRPRGSHVHCRLFGAHGAKHGDLVFDTREWPLVYDALLGVMDVLPEEG